MVDPVPDTFDRWDRLATAVNARLRDLAVSQAELAKRADLSPIVIREIQAGVPKERRPTTWSKLARALEWSPGSIEAILEGQTPTLDEASGFDSVDAAAALRYIQGSKQEPQDESRGRRHLEGAFVEGDRVLLLALVTEVQAMRHYIVELSQALAELGRQIDQTKLLGPLALHPSFADDGLAEPWFRKNKQEAIDRRQRFGIQTREEWAKLVAQAESDGESLDDLLDRLEEKVNRDREAAASNEPDDRSAGQ